MASQSALTLRTATPADLPAARRLFAEFPYKAIQAAAQRLDRERLVDFYAAGLKSALEKGAAPHWLVEAEENGIRRPIALAGLAGDPWHSDVYNVPMGKVGPFLNAETLGARASSPVLPVAGSSDLGLQNSSFLREEAGRLLLRVIDAAARERGLRHLSVRLDGEDFPNLHLFEADGWRLVDVSLKFSRPMPFDSPVIPQPVAAPGWRVDLATVEDAGWIRHIGSETHGGTHFLNDPALPAEKTRELFARWLDRCLNGLAYKVYVLRDGAGEGRGFVTYLRGLSFAKAVGRSPIILDFVLLDPAIRGGGLGAWLVAESLAREAAGGFNYCELRTSAHNLGAVMTYEKLGFRCCASDFALNKSL